MTYYLCNKKKPCANGAGCDKSGLPTGMCNHTSNPEYAINGECKDPWNHPERFICVRKPSYQETVPFWMRQDAGDYMEKEMAT